MFNFDPVVSSIRAFPMLLKLLNPHSFKIIDFFLFEPVAYSFPDYCRTRFIRFRGRLVPRGREHNGKLGAPIGVQGNRSVQSLYQLPDKQEAGSRGKVFKPVHPATQTRS